MIRVGARTASTELIRSRTKSFRPSITRIARMFGCSPGRSASARLASLRYIVRRRAAPAGALRETSRSPEWHSRQFEEISSGPEHISPLGLTRMLRVHTDQKSVAV